MPRYMLLIVEDEAPYQSSDKALFDEIMAMHASFSASVREAGAAVLGGDALRGRSTASYLRHTRTQAVVAVDCPSAELKEVLGGYYLIEASDDAQALQLAMLCPAPYGYVEVRPIWEFGE